jgi:hypothetical protein
MKYRGENSNGSVNGMAQAAAKGSSKHIGNHGKRDTPYALEW